MKGKRKDSTSTRRAEGRSGHPPALRRGCRGGSRTWCCSSSCTSTCGDTQRGQRGRWRAQPRAPSLPPAPTPRTHPQRPAARPGAEKAGDEEVELCGRDGGRQTGVSEAGGPGAAVIHRRPREDGGREQRPAARRRYLTQ